MELLIIHPVFHVVLSYSFGDIPKTKKEVEQFDVRTLTSTLSHYLRSAVECLVKLCPELDRLLPPCVSVISRGEAYCYTLSLPVARSDVWFSQQASYTCACWTSSLH